VLSRTLLLQAAYLYKRVAIPVSLTTTASSLEDDMLYKSLPRFTMAHTARNVPDYGV
jgi:hypothetical protein